MVPQTRAAPHPVRLELSEPSLAARGVHNKDANVALEHQINVGEFRFRAVWQMIRASLWSDRRTADDPKPHAAMNSATPIRIASERKSPLQTDSGDEAAQSGGARQISCPMLGVGLLLLIGTAGGLPTPGSKRRKADNCM